MKYDLGKEFHAYPMGRKLGREFREEVLVPEFEKIRTSVGADKFVISLDSCRSFGSSFLEEAFGGLVRKEGFSREFILHNMELVAQKEGKAFFADMIKNYVRDAKPEAGSVARGMGF